MRTILVSTLLSVVLAPIARGTVVYGGYFRGSTLLTEIPLDYQVAPTLGFSKGIPPLSSGVPNAIQAMLFTDNWWTPADVGKTLWISDGPDFEIARQQLTDGNADMVRFGMRYRKLDGTPQGDKSPSLFTPESIMTGSNTPPDFQNYRIDRIGIKLISMGYVEQFVLDGTHYYEFGIQSGAAFDLTPLPEPGPVGATAVAAGTLTLARRRRRVPSA